MRSSNFIITMTAAALILPMAESTRDAVLRESATVAADKRIADVPGKRLLRIPSTVDQEPAHIYLLEESCFENVGASHRTIENADSIVRARPLPLFIVDATDEQVTGPNSW